MEEIPKAYDPKEVEDKWYSYWEQKGFFKADSRSSKKSFTIVIPPPNVTGVLHMGHALVDTLQDILIRWKRMCGFEALWVPGTDHAGIATQTVVERNLMKTLGKRRSDFSREEFLKHVWKWKNESEQQIINQIKKVGCSCDWDRLAFTMDETRSFAVRTMFKKMFDDGLIYRGDYLVNWDPVTQTALADDEVEYEEKESALYYIRYPIPHTSHYLVIATVRPETLLGDTAVAVSPEDIRYQTFIGQPITIPLVNRNVPIIGDPHIDPKFGTGVVKITPAHDADDYAMAQRHHLPMINIMTPDGRINANGGEFQGMPIEEARKAIVEKLKSLGFLEKVEKYTHRVGVSYRSKAVIEPYLSKQWFVKVTHFKDKLIQLVQSKKVKLIPESFENTYYHWIDNLRDWCISRQLWWGHRIPIWYRVDNPDVMICYAGEGVPPEVAKNPSDWMQDPDVLDTWFSSALWPFSVMGWPEKTSDMRKFYPTQVLVTGHDILFFWVARMIMMGEYALETPPFSEVFLHGLIFGKSYWRYNSDGSIAYLGSEERQRYDSGESAPPEVQSRWEKMSKSKGNIIDPLEIINSFGADAMRMALTASTTHARQIDLDRRRFEEFKNFANKVWNGARFVFMNLENLEMGDGINLDLITLEDRWMLSRLNRIIQEVNASLKDYSFDKAALAAYDFFWKEFCAYYLEMTKPVLFGKLGTPAERSNKQKILLVVLCNAVRLLHPMAPFITEELFQLLKKQFGIVTDTQDPYTQETLRALQAPACIVAPYPKVIREIDMDAGIEEEFAAVDQLVHAIRNIRAEMQIPPGTATALHLVGPKDRLSFAEKHQGILKALVRLESLSFAEKETSLPFASTTNVGDLKIIVPLPAEMREKEKVRLAKERDKLIQQQQGARVKLGNQDFLMKAPPELIQKLQTTLQQTEKDLFEISQKLEKL
ncbi:MAG: valine--tRNA ligase [Verrucomicrobia bacterium]|nr:valine--tRNA ligase [Verrucomicrobiota bacterium]